MKKVYSIFVCLCMLAGFVACDKDQDFALTTLTVTNETVTPSYETAEVSCSFKADATISEAYVQYSLSSSFADYEVAKMTDEKGKYVALLTGLVDNTTYYIRYTVSNKFSNVVADAVAEFQTLSCTVPTIVLDSIGGVRESHAKAYMHLTFDGGASVTDMGICWSTEASPTIEDIHKSTKDTAAVLDITNLQENTKYYVRAYAVNRVGTAYSEEQVFTTESVFSEPTGTENGYGYVDLGLSVKWATMNVGASSPEEYGNYYAWGETEPKDSYYWTTYKYSNGSETTLTKYNTSTMAGTVDNKTTLELSDDAAYINWDGNWRMPSEAEWEELREQCTWIWTTKNGIKGHKVTSKINDNNIFLPASGRRFIDALTGVGMDGNYWSNTLNVASPCEAMYVLFISNGASSFGSDRYVGHSVRPVLGEKVVELTPPIVATTVVTQITATTAVAGGNVISNGGAEVTECGVCIATISNPTTANTKILAGSGTGEFTCDITGLQEGTKYYIRAYAVNSVGTAYGEEVVFTTSVTGVPTVSTTQPSQITETTAFAGGNVTSDGGASVSERGVVYSLSANPAITDLSSTIVRSGNGTGAFTCNLSNLQAGTTYYVRAYAINSKGTAYGDEISFTTALPITLATVTTASITQITETTAVAGGTVTNDGNASVTERGVCISTVSNPTTSNTKITAGTGTGSFTCNLTNLQANTTYYVRAYAINSKGTAYGEEVTFTTNKQVVLPSVITAAITQITETSAVAGGNVTSDGGASVTERGVVYSTNTNPVITNLNNTIRPCGSGTGAFTYTMIGLQPNTTYYVRAYATNEVGTAYGEEVSFTTNEEMVDNPPSNLVAMPFSVSAGKQVTFSQGNLQYTQSTNTWSFAKNQWDMIGTDNVIGGSVTSDPSFGYDIKVGTALADKVDLFGWSTSATNFGISTSMDENDYSGSFVDWGANTICDDAPNTWRTLTYDEWNYLRYNRTNAGSLVGVAQVNGVNGLILLPDNWTCPDGVTFKSGFHSNYGVDYYAAYQTFTAEQWSKLESAGAVFLPAAGGRAGSDVGRVQGYGYYWSASGSNSLSAYYLYFSSGRAGIDGLNRSDGQSVRLVKDL